MKTKNKDEKELKGFLKNVEKIGNALPHPAMIFVILSAFLIVISAIVAKTGKPVTYFNASTGADVTVSAISLLNAEGLRFILNSATKNFTGFAPLGTVIVAMLGVGVAEWTGLIDSLLKKMLDNINPRFLTYAVVFAGIISNIASDAGYLVVIPIGAVIFAAAGRHPIAGLAAAFAGVSGGFSANLIFGPTDSLLQGITNQALISGGINYEVAITGNWYFLIASTFLLTIVGGLVTEHLVEKNLGPYHGSYAPSKESLTDLEIKGLKYSGLTLVVLLGILAFMMIGENALLKTFDENLGVMNLKYFMSNGLIFVIMILFAIPGYVFGKITGKIKDSNDLVEAMTVAMKGLGGYLVLAFFASQFIAYFTYTNLGIILSVNGAEFLKSINFTGIPLIIGFILISAFLNLFMGSASAKWAIMAPIFVPMMFELGLSPELTQAAYRIGDSSTNIITPLMSYFAMIVVFAKKYDDESGLGTLISTMIPYSIAFLLSWSVLIIIWYYLNLPLGPGAFIHI